MHLLAFRATTVFGRGGRKEEEYQHQELIQATRRAVPSTWAHANFTVPDEAISSQDLDPKGEETLNHEHPRIGSSIAHTSRFGHDPKNQDSGKCLVLNLRSFAR